MGTTNHGTQAITFQYYLEATAENFGKLCMDIIPTGIYSGGRAEILGDSSLQIRPFVIAIQDSTNQVTVRSTVSAVLTTGVLDSGVVSSSTPYLILRWIHTSSAANYVEIHAIASLSARQQYDLVIGRMTFTGAVLTGFDYTDRSHPRSSDVAFRVEPTATPSMSLIVHGGRFPLGNSNYPVPDTQIGPFTLPAAPFSRIDLVYVSAAGAVTILQGTPAVTPVVPDYGGRLVLAEVRVVTGDSALDWSRITDVRPSLWPSAVPDEATINYDATGKLSINRVQVVPKWNVTVCNANNLTLPSQFTSPIAEFSIPSFGTYCGTHSSVQNIWLLNNSVRFRMTVNSIGSNVKTLKLFGVDNWVYIYIDGVEVYRYVGAAYQWDSPLASIPLNLTNGDRVVDIVFADQGGSAYLNIVGDIVDGVYVLFKA